MTVTGFTVMGVGVGGFGVALESLTGVTVRGVGVGGTGVAAALVTAFTVIGVGVGVGLGGAKGPTDPGSIIVDDDDADKDDRLVLRAGLATEIT